MSDFQRIPVTELRSTFEQILLKTGFDQQRAGTLAEVFTNNSIDGIYSHGVNRFPKFIGMVNDGSVKPSALAKVKSKSGNVEQWDGQLAPGPVNALACTDRAVELARTSGIGCVALANTNHWMRGGTYGWRAARAGCVFIGWSNTIANTPAWGAIDSKLGNNPLVIAIPYNNDAIVLDMAMSQFSYGAMEMYELKRELLPVPGGFDTAGMLTTDPSEIKKSTRTLPIGYWKGSGLSLLLDILGAVLSGGLSVSEITKQETERSLSQIFIAIDLSKLGDSNSITKTIRNIVDDFKSSKTEVPGKTVRYPGENILVVRSENLSKGIPVSGKVWSQIQTLLS